MTPLYDCGNRAGRNPERGKQCRLRGVDINRARTTENRYAIAKACPRLEPAFRVAHDTTVKEIRRHALHKEEFFNLFHRRVPCAKRRSERQVILIEEGEPAWD